MAAGLGLTIWPQIFSPSSEWSHNGGVVTALLGAIGLLVWLGLWRPLQMLPLLLFEVAWKVIWLTRMALPAWQSGQLDPAMRQSVVECLLILPFLFLIPWDEAWRRIVRAPTE